MDLKDAFHQVPLHPDSRPYTGTDTPIGIQQWKVVPMGWKNGVAYCQRNLEVGLAPVSDIASGYIDDILVGTPLQEKDAIKEMLLQHDKDLRRTLDGLKAADFVASGPKCSFFIKDVEFCGHCLREGVTKPLPGRLLSLEKWELPKTITALRSFLGFCNY